MRRLLIIACLALCAATGRAQGEAVATVAQQRPAVTFGYLSYDATLRQLPEYAAAQRTIADLRAKYAAEMKRVEDDFRAKYEQFLDGQRDFAPSILRKRQAELTELMEKNMAFKAESERLLRQAEDEAMAPVRAKLAAAVQRVGQAHQLAFVLNTDNNTVPYVNTLQGLDVTAAVLAAAR